eukprot:5335199-Prymnesium_polylepis.1
MRGWNEAPAASAPPRPVGVGSKHDSDRTPPSGQAGAQVQRVPFSHGEVARRRLRRALLGEARLL